MVGLASADFLAEHLFQLLADDDFLLLHCPCVVLRVQSYIYFFVKQKKQEKSFVFCSFIRTFAADLRKIA